MILLNFLTFLLLLLSLFSYFPFTLTLPHCSLRPDDVVLGAVPEFGDVFDVAVLPDDQNVVLAVTSGALHSVRDHDHRFHADYVTRLENGLDILP